MKMELASERAYADSLAARLSPAQFSQWEDCRSAHRFLAYKGKEILIYRLWFNEPKIMDRLTLQSVSADIDRGLSSVWTSEVHRQITLSHTPTMVADGVFMWHVFGSEALYQPYKGRWGLSVPLAYRTRVNPVHRQDGVNYAIERSVYETTIGA